MPRRMLPNLGCFFLLLWLVSLAPVYSAPKTAPPTGLRENTPTVHALVGARIVISPDKTIERGNIIIRDGVITALGPDIAVPPDATVWQLTGKTIYPGFIDAFSELPANAAAPTTAGPGYWNLNVVPEFRAAQAFKLDRTTNEKLRRQGITARLVAPSQWIIKGTSALVTTGDRGPEETLLKGNVALHVKLTVSRFQGSGEGPFPKSPMGALALVRQAFYDARWSAEAWRIYQQHPSLPRPEQDVALRVLADYLEGRRPVIIDASDTLYFFRADQIAREFGLNVIVRGSGEEYQRLDAIKATQRPVIVPVNFPKAPNVRSPEAALSVPLDKLMHWDIAPENPARLDEAGVKIALTTYGLKDASTFLSAVRQAVEHGLKPASALRALTVTPALLTGIDDRLGTLEVGKLAHLVVTDGDLFNKKTKIVETWVDGQRYEVVAKPVADLRGTWELQVARPDGGSETLTLKLTGEPAKLAGAIHRGAKEAKLVNVLLSGSQLTVTFRGKTLGWDGSLQASATVLDGDKPQTPGMPPLKEDRPPSLLGTLLWADGQSSAITARRTASFKPADNEKPAKDEKKEASDDQDAEKKDAEEKDLEEKGEEKKDDEPSAKDQPKSKRPTRALYPVNYPLGEFGLERSPEQPAAVLFRKATVWTCGPDGTFDNADVLVKAGKIIAVGKKLKAPKRAVIVDARGKHITPGIIDCHSHIATDGGVNEASQSITAEVRIGDFIDSYDINIYRQLGGGVTVANILHGSANTIGGQNQVIKFRWGVLPEEAKFAAAPPGIKFALGENVKQSNWSSSSHSRYPQTRMGVEQLMRDAFRSAQEYRDHWQRWEKNKEGLPPRIDLEQQALVEVLAGKRLIHCHSYRQDEILACLRVCEDFGIRIGTFQHILEGYKVADLMARHGVGGSSFSDWWAYKFEVYDAIPYNGALLHKAGVVVSFNSDDAELARRLNLEAAKAVKYGGVSPNEALKFVTLNPAKQLGIDKYVGSLEPGKDADLVIWNGSPLSTLARCEQTWIDGRKYFDREDDATRRKQVAQYRAALVQRILDSGEAFAGPDDDKKDEWPREDEFCHDHDEKSHGGAHQ